MENRNVKLAAEVIRRCRELAAFSEDAGSIRRTFLSPPMHDVHREIGRWLEPLGVKINIDAAGNLRGLYPAQQESASRLLIGSHLDTVPNAGAFDGILGVVLGVALLEALDGHRLPYAIEIVGFSEEEGVRFALPFIGSRALVGRVDEELLARTDANGISVAQAIAEFGLDASEMKQAVLGNDVGAYLEFHIEQGPVLESLGLPLALVEAIAGQSRMEFRFLGRANHAGTTPMNLRHDAVAAAAEWITFVEAEAQRIGGLVATVGRLDVTPGAVNVIAGEARLSLDVRHRDDAVRIRAVDTMTKMAEQIAERRGLSVTHETRMSQAVVPMDASLSDEIESAIRQAACQPHRMVSGAGHDAMIIAEKIPAAMMFLRTPGGISHDPAESVAVEDVEKAIECGLNLLHRLASWPALQTRTCRA